MTTKDPEVTRIKGYVWPASDTECRKVVFDTVSDMIPALNLVGPMHEMREMIAFQAGGNCGVWANFLAEHFKMVITAEPNPLNYHCLKHNIRGNVKASKCGVGEKAEPASMEVDPANMGAGQMVLGTGAMQMRTIDSLLNQHSDGHLGFLCLDIEGMELPALKGASYRIDRDSPVIQIEDKGLSMRYGYAKGDAEAWLAENFGYVVHSRPHRDVILHKP